jgi:hypothetical protein
LPVLPATDDGDIPRGVVAEAFDFVLAQFLAGMKDYAVLDGDNAIYSFPSHAD